MSMSRLPKQSSFMCADFAGMGYIWADKDSFNDIAISRPEYDQEYEWKRRTWKEYDAKSSIRSFVGVWKEKGLPFFMGWKEEDNSEDNKTAQKIQPI